jgi:hypothetical protein
MKIWKIYRISEVDGKPTLYAITGIKEFVKRFTELRDMSKFKVVKGNMDRNDFATLVKHDRSRYIDTYNFITSGFNKNKVIKATRIEIPVPVSEYECLRDELDMIFNDIDYSIDWNNIFALDMFNKKVLNALLRLGYYSVFRYNCRYIDIADEEEVYDKIESMETSYNIMPEFDEYIIYMRIYGESYKS